MSPQNRPATLLTATGLRYEYRSLVPVLDGVDLALEPGLTLLVGPNGCGKSTLLRLLAGIETPLEGSVDVNGRDLWRDEAAARSALVYLPEQPELVPYATVREIVQLVASLRGAAAGEVERAIAAAGIEGVIGRTTRQLSHGQRRRVLVAAALLAEPRVALLDEPLEGLDRGAQDRLLAWLDRLLETGAAALVVSHRLEPFLARASAVATLVRGRLLLRRLSGEKQARRRELVEAIARGEASVEN